MNTKIYLSYGTLITPFGIGITQNTVHIQNNLSAIKKVEQAGFKQEDLYLAKMDFLKTEHENSRFDQLLILALDELVKKYDSNILQDAKTLFIVSSTKGNMDNLPNDVFESSRKIIAQKTKNPNDIVIICQACISGVVATNIAADYIRYSDFDTAVVIGIDVLNDFITFGFQSLFALSASPVRPFDEKRNGISLGEACGIVVLSRKILVDYMPQSPIEYLTGSSVNDAFHISAPSPTGEGLFRSIQKTLTQAQLNANNIDFISAHGTGTLYNDNMESIALSRSKLQQTPVNSLKGFFGHTLGASGIIELIICMFSIEKQLIIQSKGFQNLGTTEQLNIVRTTKPTHVHTILKTASGFGGGNATLIIQKSN